MSFWKKLAKIASIAAPIVAAPFTGGTSLALIGAGAGAAGGALSGGGVKGALLGAGLGAIPGLGKAAAGAGAATSAAGSMPFGVGADVFSKAGGSGMFGQLAGVLKSPDVWRGAGAMLGAGSQAGADNRGAQLEASAMQERLRQDAERQFYEQLLAREQEGRAGATDAMRKVQQTEYIAGNRPRVAAPNVSPYHTGGSVSGVPTGAERQGAMALQGEAMKRLEGGNPIPMPQQRSFAFDPKMLKPGMFERLAGIIGPGLVAGSTAFGDRKQ